MSSASSGKVAQEVFPKSGIVYSERSNLTDVLCKPKIMPIKSVTLEKLEQMEKQFLRAQNPSTQPGDGNIQSF